MMLSSLQSAWPGNWISRAFFTSTATRRSARVCSVTTFCLLHSAITMMAVSGAPVPVSEDAGAGLAERRILSAETAKAVEDAQAVAGTANAELLDTTIILVDKASAAAVADTQMTLAQASADLAATAAAFTPLDPSPPPPAAPPAPHLYGRSLGVAANLAAAKTEASAGEAAGLADEANAEAWTALEAQLDAGSAAFDADATLAGAKMDDLYDEWFVSLPPSPPSWLSEWGLPDPFGRRRLSTQKTAEAAAAADAAAQLANDHAYDASWELSAAISSAAHANGQAVSSAIASAAADAIDAWSAADPAPPPPPPWTMWPPPTPPAFARRELSSATADAAAAMDAQSSQAFERADVANARLGDAWARWFGANTAATLANMAATASAATDAVAADLLPPSPPAPPPLPPPPPSPPPPPPPSPPFAGESSSLGESSPGGWGAEPAATASAAAEEELRVDVTDGRAYTKADFISFYGGTAEWERSPVFRPLPAAGGAAEGGHAVADAEEEETTASSLKSHLHHLSKGDLAGVVAEAQRQQEADPTGSKVVDKFDAKMSKYDPTGGMVHDGATAYKDIAADLFG